MKLDYLVVGCGLAGIAFCELLRKQNKSFAVFNDQSQQSSIVAAGLYNPVTLKRFTEVWEAQVQLDLAIPHYAELEQLLKVKIDYKLPILRRFTSIEEQNNWFNASDNPALKPFLSEIIIKENIPGIDAPFGFGEVLYGGRVDTDVLIDKYLRFLKKNNLLIDERFNYHNLVVHQKNLNYNNLQSKYIVFAEGFGVKQNPFFKNIPLNGTKGEVLEVEIPDLDIEVAVKSSVFLLPLGNQRYYVGATYNWHDKTNLPTDDGKEELIKKLKQFVKLPFEVVNHRAGVRPTTVDRRPLVGAHSDYKNIFVLNGLGTRGVMIAPYIAKALFEFIENGKPLPDEININRF
ncbi:FAD-binding oxidoreductase [Paucihalobacter ruber]|uniref:FAD-binding oxidoreductase n=1 Tax=Paucihalobacter ruber TaxID=2567861 RepID=A0A506PQT6_9FLAO|nr:FAD-binding oxidoreductase [Paucihalobacter ruber]TPV35622.1 FAD-binding oxidoreductase [Paucihalobacter ruber]